MAQTGFIFPEFSSPRSTIPRQSHSSKRGAMMLTSRKLTHRTPPVMFFIRVSSHSGIGGMTEDRASVI